jgi:hypothetical protein
MPKQFLLRYIDIITSRFNVYDKGNKTRETRLFINDLKLGL